MVAKSSMVAPSTSLFSQQTMHATWRGWGATLEEVGYSKHASFMDHYSKRDIQTKIKLFCQSLCHSEPCLVRCRLPPIDGYVAVCLIICPNSGTINNLFRNSLMPKVMFHPCVTKIKNRPWGGKIRKPWQRKKLIEWYRVLQKSIDPLFLSGTNNRLNRISLF